MRLEVAQELASEIKSKLAPYCTRIEVAGSVRRYKPEVRDIDFVLIPYDPWGLSTEIAQLGQSIVSGEKLKRVNHNGVQIDLYYATERTFPTLFLVKTGSAENNIRLATLAKKRGWHLAANGDGLLDENSKRIAGDTEMSIYDALDLPYQDPWERG